MNRDDRIIRPSATPPQYHEVAGVSAVYPSEHRSGTWIAANQFGITLALLNWNRPKLTPKLRSRGRVILGLLSADSTAAIERALRQRTLQGVWPFRLFAFLGPEFRVREWRWDGLNLALRSHPWRSGHWFSSGLSDVVAARERRRIFDSAARDADAGTLSWLRKLHRQHGSEPGPFSVCVHRNDAATLSYTEVVLRGSHICMRYAAGQPCTSLRAGALSSAGRAILHMTRGGRA